MRTFATLFTGGDGFGVGARAAGLKSTWGVEIDPKIAGWAERNDPSLCVFRGDVSEVDYAGLRTPYLFHVSPQCKRASKANQQGEGEEDVAQAGGVVFALWALRPPVFTLENVWGYRNFQAFKNILRALSDLGYKVDFWHLHAADYGVPQTRKRLVLIARRDDYPVKPVPTHTNPKNVNFSPRLFGENLKPWVGWYEAIEDLLPELPDSEFAPWQVARLPEELKTFLVGSGNTNFAESKPDTSNGTIREKDDPSMTVVTRSRSMPRSFVVDCQKNGTPDSNGGKRGLTIRQATEPIFTVMGGSNKPSRAALPGRVVKLTPRALAQLQSVPDWYELPDSDRLACTIIGNMVPPLLAQRIVESIVK